MLKFPTQAHVKQCKSVTAGAYPANIIPSNYKWLKQYHHYMEEDQENEKLQLKPL